MQHFFHSTTQNIIMFFSALFLLKFSTFVHKLSPQEEAYNFNILIAKYSYCFNRKCHQKNYWRAEWWTVSISLKETYKNHQDRKEIIVKNMYQMYFYLEKNTLAYSFQNTRSRRMENCNTKLQGNGSTIHTNPIIYDWIGLYSR